MHSLADLIEISICFYYRYMVAQTSSFFITIIFVSIQLLKWTSRFFNFTFCFPLFSWLLYSTLNADWFFFFAFLIFTAKYFNNFLTIKIVNDIHPRHVVFNIFIPKHFFRPIWSITFSCKNVFIFLLWYYIFVLIFLLGCHF